MDIRNYSYTYSYSVFWNDMLQMQGYAHVRKSQHEWSGDYA